MTTHIVCVKWGDLYGPEYVNKLYRAVERNTTLDFQFTCFTDDPNDVDNEVACRDLPASRLTGWWNKMYLFSSDTRITDRILYFDLDTVIVANIDEYMTFDGEFLVLRDFYSARTKPKGDRFGSGLMSWQGGTMNQIWSDFYANWEQNSKTGGGDQKYLEKVMMGKSVAYWQDFLKQSDVVSYKVHCREASIPPTRASVVCFHGQPRPHMVSEENWMQKHWI